MRSGVPGFCLDCSRVFRSENVPVPSFAVNWALQQCFSNCPHCGSGKGRLVDGSFEVRNGFLFPEHTSLFGILVLAAVATQFQIEGHGFPTEVIFEDILAKDPQTKVAAEEAYRIGGNQGLLRYLIGAITAIAMSFGAHSEFKHNLTGTYDLNLAIYQITHGGNYPPSFHHVDDERKRHIDEGRSATQAAPEQEKLPDELGQKQLPQTSHHKDHKTKTPQQHGHRHKPKC